MATVVYNFLLMCEQKVECSMWFLYQGSLSELPLFFSSPKGALEPLNAGRPKPTHQNVGSGRPAKCDTHWSVVTPSVGHSAGTRSGCANQPHVPGSSSRIGIRRAGGVSCILPPLAWPGSRMRLFGASTHEAHASRGGGGKAKAPWFLPLWWKPRHLAALWQRGGAKGLVEIRVSTPDN